MYIVKNDIYVTIQVVVMYQRIRYTCRLFLYYYFIWPGSLVLIYQDEMELHHVPWH